MGFVDISPDSISCVCRVKMFLSVGSLGARCFSRLYPGEEMAFHIHHLPYPAPFGPLLAPGRPEALPLERMRRFNEWGRGAGR